MQVTGKAIIAVIMLLAGSMIAQQTKRQEIDLQAAMRTETVHGDLKGAIQQYNAIVSKYGKTDRTVAAKALVRMGQCYEKLGDAESRKAYERVVREFGDQKDLVETARARLAALGRPAAPAGITVRRVFEDLPGELSAVSPDGRYVIHFEDRTTSNYMVRDLTTGQSRRLTSYEKLYRMLSWDPLFSPDSRQVAYGTYGGGSFQALHVVGVDGASDRVVWRSDDYFDLNGWFPDGSRVAVTTYPKEKSLAAVALADGTVRVLKRGGYDGWLSPGGKYYVFDKRVSETDPRHRDIWCLSLEDGSETPLFEYPANNRDPRWAPDGKGVIFTSNRLGTRGLWYLPVSAGKPAGPVELIKGDVGENFWPISLTRDGALYYSSGVALMNSLMAELDSATGKIVSGPTDIAPKSSGHTQNAAFSADGKWLAYYRKKRFREDRYTLVLRSLATGEEREMATQFRTVYAQRWFPAGQSLLVYAEDTERNRGYYRFDITTGKSTLLARSSVAFHALSPDGKTLYLVRGQEDVGILGTGEVYTAELDPATGKVLAPPAPVASRFWGTNGGPSWSPDGQYLAYHSWRGPLKFDASGALTIVIKSVKTGEERDLSVRLQQDGPVGWFPDGKSFLVAGTTEDESGQPHGFYRINAESGEVSLIKRLIPGRTDGKLSPDGKAIFYVLRETGKDQRLMVYQMESGEEKELLRIASPQSIFLSWRLCPSPDGRQLAFVLGNPATNSAAIKTIPAQGGEVRELVGGLRYREVAHGALGGWSPDSRYLYYVMSGQSAGLWRVSTDGGQPQKLDVGMQRLLYPAVHPDGRRISFNAGNPYHALCSRNLETGEEHVLLQNDNVWIYPAVSADGRQLAVARIEGGDSLLEILPLGGGSRREILRLRAAEALLGYLTFSPDGREIFFSRRAPKGERVELWRVSAQGGAPVKTDVWVPQVREQAQDWDHIIPAPTDYAAQQFRGLAFHPDGRRFVFDAGSERSEYWVMENFLPKAAK